MAAFLTRAFDVPPSDVDAFGDDDASVFQDDINALAASGITKGCKTDSFCPEAQVGRDQMASLLARALGLPMVEVPDAEVVNVTRVIDGDTIEVEIAIFEEVSPGEFIVGHERRSVRLIGIDTPEVGETCAVEATEAMKALVENALVRIDMDLSDVDQSNRLLRYVFQRDGMFVNEAMVSMGWARSVEYPPDTKYGDVLAIAEAEAQAAGRGLWGSRCANPTTSITDAGPEP